MIPLCHLLQAHTKYTGSCERSPVAVSHLLQCLTDVTAHRDRSSPLLKAHRGHAQALAVPALSLHAVRVRLRYGVPRSRQSCVFEDRGGLWQRDKGDGGLTGWRKCFVQIFPSRFFACLVEKISHRDHLALWQLGFFSRAWHLSSVQSEMWLIRQRCVESSG